MSHQPLAVDHLRRLLATTWDSSLAPLPNPIPWPEVAQMARSRRVGPLIYAAVQEAALRVPDEICTTLQQSYYLTARANMLSTLDLAPILAGLAAKRVPVLLTKGLALAETLYQNVALRPMTDVDLVVPPGCLSVCQEILLEFGYVATSIELKPGANLTYRNEQVFADTQRRRSPVEVHWHLLDLPYYLCKVPMAWFWDNSQAHQIGDQPVQVLNPEANVVYLSAHLALHHRFHGLRWFVDLATLVHRHQETLDWKQISEAAQAFELLHAVRETMDRLAACWPSLPLAEPLRQLHSLQPTAFEARLFRLLTAEPRTPLLDFYSDLVGLPDLPARIRFLLLNTFPQRAYMAQRYGIQRTWQLPLWYLFRLGDGAVKLARTLPQVLRLGQT